MNQLIDHAKSQKKPILFIIDDTKQDWWRQHKEKRDEILGPRPELVEEMDTKAGISFYMYHADEFINQAPLYLDVQINPETIKEVKEVRQQTEYAYNISIKEPLYNDLLKYLIAHGPSTSKELRFLLALKNWFSHSSLSEAQKQAILSENLSPGLQNLLLQSPELNELVERTKNDVSRETNENRDAFTDNELDHLPPRDRDEN